MIHLRHRTASGELTQIWEYDPARRVVDIVFALGSAKPQSFTIPVCGVDRPRIGTHPIVRLDGESWRILPSLFVPADASSRVRVPQAGAADVALEPRSCAPRRQERRSPCDLHESIGCGTHVVLTNAPPNVDLELAELSL